MQRVASPAEAPAVVGPKQAVVIETPAIPPSTALIVNPIRCDGSPGTCKSYSQGKLKNGLLLYGQPTKFQLCSSSPTLLLKGNNKTLDWSMAAEQAFTALKEKFTTAPVLKCPSPDLLFEVKVDASDTGVGAVLSQRSGTPPNYTPA
ncbi:hypothetical protein NFI96_025915, partial [Prochilodus magdalenae]